MVSFYTCVRRSLFLSICFFVAVVTAQPEWAQLYRKSFGGTRANMREFSFTRIDIQPFTQLLCSWNALRPSKGYFSIYLQARDTQTKQWGRSHHVADWGAGVQRSFMDKADSFDQFVHVRLEIGKKRRADAFRMKVVPKGGADPGLLRGLAAATADFTRFAPEKVSVLNDLRSVAVKGVPSISQFALDHEDRDRICSPTSSTMLASFLFHKRLDPLKFAANAYDFGLGVYGSWPFSTAHAFDCTGGSFRFFVTRLNSFAQLHCRLMRGMPVVVSIRGPMNRAPRPFASGHLLLVTGWDAATREVICHDPAFEQDDLVQQRYELSEFIPAWERSHRLAYCAESAA